MTKATAPGKVILFGEHAVVYGRPALAVPVTQVHTEVEVSDASGAGIWIHARQVDLHAEFSTLPPEHPIAAVIQRVFTALNLPFPVGGGVGDEGTPSIDIKITSTIPVASGLGSGAAVSVALIRALSSHLNHSMSDEQVNALAYEVEKLHHGTPSGIDNSVITYTKPVYFIIGQPIETFKVGKPFTIVIGDTGIRALTKESVGSVRKLWETDKTRWEKVFVNVGELVSQARKTIENGEWELLGSLMDQNHVLLQEMTVSSPELDALVRAARQAGALGAKLSGGGRGGNMIALIKPDIANAVSKSIKDAGAKNVIITQVA